MMPAGDQVIKPAHLGVKSQRSREDCWSIADGGVLRRSERARLDALATAHDRVRDHVGIGAHTWHMLCAPSDECRYLIVCLGGVRMPTWKQEPPSRRHVVSVGNG